MLKSVILAFAGLFFLFKAFAENHNGKETEG